MLTQLLYNIIEKLSTTTLFAIGFYFYLLIIKKN